MRCFCGWTGLLDSILVMPRIPLKVTVAAYLNRTVTRPSSCITLYGLSVYFLHSQNLLNSGIPPMMSLSFWLHETSPGPAGMIMNSPCRARCSQIRSVSPPHCRRALDMDRANEGRSTKAAMLRTSPVTRVQPSTSFTPLPAWCSITHPVSQGTRWSSSFSLESKESASTASS